MRDTFWTDRAWLGRNPDEAFQRLNGRDRLRSVIMRWFDALAPHRRVTREMLMYKLEFGHIHLQALGIMRISRTVQWFREAAGRDTRDLRRILEETTLTGIYLLSFAYWMYDESSCSEATHRFLDRRLRHAEILARLLDKVSPDPPT